MAATGSDWQHLIEHASASDVGLRRSNNQDALAVVPASTDQAWRTRGHLFIVADGMGAHAAGELASKLSADTIPHTYHKLQDRDIPDALRQAIQEANHIIHTRGKANLDFQGMGTTTTALVLLPDNAFAAHVGDSRVYRLRGNQLQQLSFDHSLLWELTAGGKRTGNIVAGNIPRNIITRSLGPNPEVEVDLEGPFPLHAGDTFLLCSDGLSGQLNDAELGKIIRCLPPNEAVQLMVHLANLRGGPDNITVIVVRVLSQGQVEEEPTGFHPLVWTAFGLGLVAAVVLLIMKQFLVAAGCAVAGLVVGLVVHLMQRSRQPNGNARSRLGRGPHGSWDVTPDASFVDELRKILQQLKDAAAEEDWKMDWNIVAALERRAQQSSEKNDFEHAIADLGRAVTHIMQELKKQQRQSGRG